jgi:Tfp pilus assembly protein PilO
MKSVVRAHIIAAILSGVMLVVTVVALFIFVKKIHAQEKRVLDARDRLASYEQNKRRLSEEKAELDVIRDRTAKLEQYVVTEDSAPTFLSSVETIAKNNGVDFTLTAAAATTATPKIPAKLHIDFSADGSFTNIQRFLSELFSQPYELRMTRLSLYLIDSANVPANGTWQLLAGIDVISF